MANFEQAIEQYQKIAAEYEIISLLATTDFRRDMYEMLAFQYRQLAEGRHLQDAVDRSVRLASVTSSTSLQRKL